MGPPSPFRRVRAVRTGERGARRTKHWPNHPRNPGLSSQPARAWSLWHAWICVAGGPGLVMGSPLFRQRVHSCAARWLQGRSPYGDGGGGCMCRLWCGEGGTQGQGCAHEERERERHRGGRFGGARRHCFLRGTRYPLALALRSLPRRRRRRRGVVVVVSFLSGAAAEGSSGAEVCVHECMHGVPMPPTMTRMVVVVVAAVMQMH